MGLMDSLTDGRFGVRFAAGARFQGVEQSDFQAVMARPDDDTHWELRLSPMRLALRPEEDGVLRADVEREARVLFQTQHAALASMLGANRPPPRTEDPDWSPLIELERVALGAAPALRLIYRTAYEPGAEVILGRLLIPVEAGLFQITVRHLARTTGLRETALLDRALRQAPGAAPRDVARQLGGQRAYDHPSEDGAFPEHGLSRVRGALAGLMDPERSGLQVLAPMPQPPSGEVLLAELGCAVSPPPRFTRVASEALGLSPTLAMFSRPLIDEVRLMDVWRGPDTLPPGPERTERLVALAQRNAREWEREGATDLRMDTRPLPEAEGVAQVSNQLQFLARGRPTRSASRWIADTDGAVFRILVGGPPYLSPEELLAEADRVAGSWRRLPEDKTLPTAPAKKWWKFW
jgi:hypothetical protein